jgi:hypothetical protein
MTVYFNLKGSSPYGIDAVTTYRAEATPTSSYALVTGLGTAGARPALALLVQNDEHKAIRVSCTSAAAGNDATATDILAGQGLVLWLLGDANVYVKTI